MRIDLLSSFSFVTPVAPTSPTQGGAGNVTLGTHSWKVTLVDQFGNESAPSVASAQLNVVTTASQVTVTLPVGPSWTVSRKVYRTVAGDTGSYKLVGTLANNTGTSFVDNIADGSLGAVAPTTGIWNFQGQLVGSYGDFAAANEVSGVSGTTPTVNVVIQESPDDPSITDASAVWLTLVTFTQQTAAANEKKMNTATPHFSRLRVQVTLGGTTPAATVAVKYASDRAHDDLRQ